MTTMSVSIRVAQLRVEPSFLARVEHELEYASRVLVLEQRGDWYRVRGAGAEGWMHQTALSQRQIILNPGAEDVDRAAATTEVALAGRGFSADVEREYRRRNTRANFNAVDRMEARSLSAQALAQFVREGGLRSV